MPLPDGFAEMIRDTTPIETFLGRFVSFDQRRSSRHRLVALCPLHEEKTPSFYVDTRKNLWRCYGCGKQGNIIHFIRALHGVSFREAVRMICDLEDIEMPDGSKPRRNPCLTENGEWRRPSQSEIEASLRQAEASANEHIRRELAALAQEAKTREQIARGIPEEIAGEEWNHLIADNDPPRFDKWVRRLTRLQELCLIALTDGDDETIWDMIAVEIDRVAVRRAEGKSEPRKTRLISPECQRNQRKKWAANAAIFESEISEAQDRIREQRRGLTRKAKCDSTTSSHLHERSPR